MASLVDSYLQADRLAKAAPELTADDIRNMPVSEFARITGRSLQPTPTLTPNRPERVSPPTARSEAVESAPDIAPETVSVRDMSMNEYEAHRASIGMGKSTSARGLFS
jgi:hypothetical protein